MLAEIYRRLHLCYGPQQWWPAESRFEVILGAILTQNTAWTNVEKALAGLKSAGLLEPEALRRLPEGRLETLIRPAGYFNQKAKKIRAFLDFLSAQYGGSLQSMGACETGSLREQLLALHGIGPETADSILLYAFGKRVFVVDAYTRRVLSRHGYCPEGIPYEQLRARLESEFAEGAAGCNEFHALFVQVGKEHCRKTPRCEECPLEPLLTETQKRHLRLLRGGRSG